MFWTSERLRPWNARDSLESSGRTTVSVSSSRFAVTPPGSSRDSSPLEPLTVMLDPSMAISTPLGTVWVRCRLGTWRPPHHTKHRNFAAHAVLPCFAVGHESLVDRDNRHAETTLHAGDLIALTVDAQARLGDPSDRRCAARSGLYFISMVRVLPACHRCRPRRTGDVALALEDLGEGHLLLRRRHGDLVVHRHVGVADAGEHVGNRIGHRHCFAPPLTNWPS